MVLQHMKANNPFTLTYGLLPQTYLSDETCTVDQIVSAFASSNPMTHSCIITGPRGSGKTALMHAVAKKLHDSKDWVVLDLNSSTPLVTVWDLYCGVGTMPSQMRTAERRQRL